MDAKTVVVSVSIIAAALVMAIGGYGPARALGSALTEALDAIARQPEASDKVMRALFVGMALIESIAIYAFVIALIILFANPLVGYITKEVHPNRNVHYQTIPQPRQGLQESPETLQVKLPNTLPHWKVRTTI